MKTTNRINKPRCVLCAKAFQGIGHNALPVAQGRCCSKCDDLIVLPARLSFATGRPAKEFVETAEALRKATQTFRKRLLREARAAK